nr:MAG: hypothetical protein DIU56_00265 [Pseudomonadota bacterium]
MLELEEAGMNVILQHMRYLVEGHEVCFDRSSGWHCDCAFFAADLTCEHILQAIASRMMRSADRLEPESLALGS